MPFKSVSRLSVVAGVLAMSGMFGMFSVVASSQGQQQGPPQNPPPGARQGAAPGQGRGRGAQTPEQLQAMFARQIQDTVQIDAAWKAASVGHMQMEKTTYPSNKDGMTIPVFIFKPLTLGPAKSHPAIVLVHPDIRGRVYAYFIPYVQRMTHEGYVVIAPEYRGSVGYGQAHYDAIDYGGAEVDDVVTAVDVLKKMPEVDPARIGIIGWSHGGMITVLAVTRFPTTFTCAAALVPVTNLFQRLARKGVESYERSIDPANRIGGTPAQKPDVYKERSALYQIEKLQIPILVHVTKNDQDVNIEEDMQLVDALRARKPDLAHTKVYENPVGGHTFDRQVTEPRSITAYTPLGTHEQIDSWNRVWTFFDWYLNPHNEKVGS